MAGIKTNTKDLGSAATRFTRAIQGEEARKKAAIDELTRKFLSQGMTPEMALNAANREYRDKTRLH